MPRRRPPVVLKTKEQVADEGAVDRPATSGPASLDRPPEASTNPVDADQPKLSILAATGASPSGRMLPDRLELEISLDGRVVRTNALCGDASLRGGYRTVYLFDMPILRGVVLKVAETAADNINEVRCAEACPAYFPVVWAHGPLQVQLGAGSQCNLHFLVAEKVTPVTDWLARAGLSECGRATLGLKCLQVWCYATLAGIKCRDLGIKQWGLRDPAHVSGVVILDSNCCLAARGRGALLGPRRMSSLWAFVANLLPKAVIENVQAVMHDTSNDATAVLRHLQQRLEALPPFRPAGPKS